MPRLTDLSMVQALLESDRNWSVYPLGDLAPGYVEHAEWRASSMGDPAIVLLYREFATPVLFALGPAASVAPILEEVDEPELFLHIRPEVLELLRPRYDIRAEAAMWRMLLDPARFPGGTDATAALLNPSDLPALQALYADGDAADEAPGFFFPRMLTEGVYAGVWEEDALVAAAGTHLLAPSVDVAAIGNVYTRRDRRGRGLATRVTSAVTGELLRRGLGTIALNVAQRNAAAARVYERLGFARHCEYREGVAVRRAP